jgi:chitin disaccharide deacetylase
MNAWNAVARMGCALVLSAVFGVAEGPRLIVRGDDMGYSHAGNLAIRRCYTEGVQSSVEVLAVSPWFPEAARILSEDTAVDVGLHLSLSSEWDTVKWRPVSDCPSLRDPDGYFWPMIFPNRNYPGRALVEQRWTLGDVEKEFRAQIELARRKIPRLSHVSGHMGCTDLGPQVKALVKRLAKEYGLDIDPAEYAVTGVGYKGEHKTPEQKIAAFTAMLEGLEDGKSYIFVDHPGLDTPELRAIHHIGYEDVAVDRQGVTDAWTSPAVREVVRRRGIRLVGYRDLKPVPSEGGPSSPPTPKP